jgi:hypothetical protein
MGLEFCLELDPPLIMDSDWVLDEFMAVPFLDFSPPKLPPEM